MPELPEVETTVKGLRQKVLNRTFVDVWSDWKKMVKRPQGFEVLQRTLKGKKIRRIWRRAKNVIFDLSDGYSLLVHQKMTGHLMVGKWKLDDERWRPLAKGPLEESTNLFIHILFTLSDGTMIALSDLRKFGKVELWKTEELLNSKEFKKLGPEPLDKSFTFEAFKERLKGKRGKIKHVLMNPEVIVGVGNIYANEALWWARIHPTKEVANLDDKELKLLYEAVKNVLMKGIEMGGESFADYRNVEGEKGNFDSERRAYKRERQPCYRCKTLIKRIIFNGRSAFFCPSCQQL